jgi:hypothetical protein
MKTVEKVWSVINIVMMLTVIALCVFNRNIDGVCGWTIGFLGYLMHLQNESDIRSLTKELQDVYEELMKAENK